MVGRTLNASLRRGLLKPSHQAVGGKQRRKYNPCGGKALEANKDQNIQGARREVRQGSGPSAGWRAGSHSTMWGFTGCDEELGLHLR